MKKIISLILCAILVLGMAVSAFAVDGNALPGTFNPAPNNNPTPPPEDTIEIIIDLTEDEPEENPTTGAPVFVLPAVMAVIGAAAVIGKRK